MQTITNTLFWRKASAWIGIIGILSTMLLTMPIPQAKAAPTASGAAIYTANNAQAGNVSTITAIFSEALSNAAGRQGTGTCAGKPTPPNSYCYDYSGANLTLGGPDWAVNETSITVVFRSQGSETNLSIAFDQADVISGPNVALKLNTMGGIEAEQTFSIQAGGGGGPPEASSAEYTADNGQGKSLIDATFTSALNSSQNTEACSFNAQRKCLSDTGNVVVTGLAGGVTVSAVVIGTGSANDPVTIVLSDINGLSNYATASFTFAAVAGVQSLQTFNTITGPNPISAVTGSDQDSTGPALDGRDFRVSWSGDSDPSGYTATKVFIVSTATAGSLTASNVATNGCSGSPCNPAMMFDDFHFEVANLPQFLLNDSEGVAFSAGTTYKACVLIDATSDTLTCSSDFTVISDSITDTNDPIIEHAPVHAAIESTNAIVNAAIFDEQTTHSNFSNTGDAQQEYFKLKYGTDVSASRSTLDGVQVSGSLFQFTIPSNAVPAAGGVIQYYLAAMDRAGNEVFICNNAGTVDLESSCQQTPFLINTLASGSRTISGRISSGGSGVSGAKVIAGGFAGAAVTTDGSGDYTFSGLPNNNGYEISAFKAGFCHNKRFESVSTANLTGINFSITGNECNFSGGSNEAPHVIASDPMEGGFNITTASRTLVAFFDQTLDTTTVNDSNAGDAGSNVFLTTDDGTTKIAGRVSFCANASQSECVGYLFGAQTNGIVFIPSADLSTNQNYSFIITESVTGQNGQSISGNAQGVGHIINFSTGGGAFQAGDISTNFGNTGQYMPPYVKAMIPGPGQKIAVDSNILLEFNEAINKNSLSGGLVLKNSAGTPISTSNSTSTGNTFVVLNPSSNLPVGDYTLEVLGQVANSNGVTMRPANDAAESAFISSFRVTSDTPSAPTVYPYITNNSTGVAVNTIFEFGTESALDPTTVTSSNITITRAGSTVTSSVQYDTSQNLLRVTPHSVLAPNSTYSISFSPNVIDLRGQSLGANPFSYTTGGIDSTAPTLTEARCDDYTCTIFFSEAMNRDLQAGNNFAASVVNHANITLTNGGADLVTANTSLTYDAFSNSVRVEGLQMTVGNSFTLTIGSGAKDLSGNAITIANSVNIIQAVVEDPQDTFGSMGEQSMFSAPTAAQSGGSIGSAVFMPGDFGNFTTNQFLSGDVVTAYPFNQMAAQDVNVFQVRFKPGVVVQDEDQFQLTFPSGTVVTNAKPDDYSPYKADMNESYGGGTVTFDTAFDSDGVQADNATRKVTAQLGVAGNTTPGVNDFYTIDLKGITNPSVPRASDSGGYTVTIKHLRSGQTLNTFTSMPYYIQSGGSNSITVNMYAGSQNSPVSGANGNIFMFASGPGGPMDRNVTLTNGIITQVDGSNASNIAYTSLPDGCYFIATETLVTLAGVDYYGKDFPEPVCVTGGQSLTQNIVLTAASGAGNAELTVKLVGSFGGRDLDIFAGGPGRFVTKTLSSVSTPNANGYTLNIPSNGQWFVGVGPAMSKGASTGRVEDLSVNPPPPVDLIVSGVGGSPDINAGFQLPNGVTFDDATNTLTLTFATADKGVTGAVKDGSGTALANVEVFMHSQGFGAPARAKTDASGAFSINVSEYGLYEIGAFKDGLPPAFQNIEVKPDGADAGTDPDIYYKGAQITNANPLVLKLKKSDYSISGKVVDASGNGIAYAPVFGNDADGNFAGGSTDANGNYAVFVAAGTWTLRSELPPSKTDLCGTFSKTVIVTTASKSSQNIEPSTSTCISLSGNVSVGGSGLANVPLMVEEWDANNNRPVVGGVFRPSSTDSDGAYDVNVVGNKTYRIGTWDPTYGELFATKAVLAADTTQDITQASVGTITFAFTGGTSSMKGFIEVKSSSTGFRKSTNLSSLATNAALSVVDGTYAYNVFIDGIGKFEGTVATGSTATINLSSSSLVTISGTVKDTSENNLANAAITLQGTGSISDVVKNVKTDSTGAYSASVKAGTYKISASLANYIPAAPTNITVSAAATQNLTLTPGGNTISGTIYESDGTTPMTEGRVMAESSDGAVVTGNMDPTNGTYSLSVANGSWTIKAVGPRHAKTTNGTVTVAGSNISGSNITLTADNTRIPKTGSKAFSANVGGTFNDNGNTGMKVTAGPGVLEAGSGSVTMSMERTFTAPETSNFEPLGDASFDITATGTSAIKDLQGNVEIQIDYSDLIAELPANAIESDLQCVYYSPERGEFVPVEGGFTLDTTTNTMTCSVNHFTSFALVLSSSALAPATPSDFAGAANGGTQVDLSWTQTSGATSYDIYRDTDSSGAFARLGSEPTVSSGSTVAYSDTGLTAGTTYYYKISALNASGESASTSYITVTTTSGATSSNNTSSNVIAGGGGGFVKGQQATTYEAADENLEEILSVYDQEVEEGMVLAEPPAEAEVSMPISSLIQDLSATDYEQHWAEAYIDRVVTLGIVQGVGENMFDPNSDITRAELTKIVLSAAGVEIPESVTLRPFRDVPTDAWYAPYIKAAKSFDIIQGYSDKKFRPNQPMNRAEALKVLIEGGLNMDIILDPTQGILGNFGLTENPFSDVPTDAWYSKYVFYAYQNGIVSGYADGTFGPEKNMTRAEFAKVIVEAMDL